MGRWSGAPRTDAMLPGMSLFLDSLWRAVGYCLHPRVIALSLLPLALMIGLSLGLGYFFWDSSLDAVRVWLESSNLMRALWGWLESMGAANLKTVVAPLVVIFAATPVLVLVTLLLVAACMGPALARLVARRRFPTLERKHGGSLLLSVGWSLGSTLLAVVAMLLSLPLWLVPPLILLLPPLIWGWLTYRVMAFDALAEHASGPERREIFRRHKLWLLGIGVVTGYLGAAPSVVWASGALFAAAFVVLVPVAIWIYTLVFAFASLWFAHYCLAALQQLRDAPAPSSPSAAAPVALPDDPSPPEA
jgi:hypothetical protein